MSYSAARYHLWIVALHEAAHAAVATALGIRIEEVSVIPTATSLGHCRYRGDPPRGAVPRSDTAKALSIVRLSHNYPGWRETRRRPRRTRPKLRRVLPGADSEPVEQWHRVSSH